ncbi:DNA polymerase beta superfamily protein [Herbiconiux sp. P18]|uniref:DNA polymerase beta superfamily protein n=1 Tax=Herbiconiux liangxiaofengii TaxID=3342795 RepID=UPI0035B715C9
MQSQTALDVIVTAEYGSRATGVAGRESDRDLMSVFVERPAQVTGLESAKTLAGSTAAAGRRSERDDVDAVIYPLRHWAALAAAGNPTALLLLFVPEHDVVTDAWWSVQGIRSAFVSQEAGHRFRGYSWSQREALTGHRSTRTNRPELVAVHGYDTKFAYHMVRTALHGVELMQTGAVALPLQGESRRMLMAVRAGEMSFDEVLALSDALDARLAGAIGASRLPETADRGRVNEVLHRVHLERWAAA